MALWNKLFWNWKCNVPSIVFQHTQTHLQLGFSFKVLKHFEDSLLWVWWYLRWDWHKEEVWTALPAPFRHIGLQMSQANWRDDHRPLLGKERNVPDACQQPSHYQAGYRSHSPLKSSILSPCLTLPGADQLSVCAGVILRH